MINKSFSSLSGREAAAGASSVFRGWGFASFLLGAFSFIVGIAALPLRLILRNNIGERSISPFSVLLAVGIHVYYFTQFDIIILIISSLGVNTSNLDIGAEGFIYFAIFLLFNPYSLFLIWACIRAVKHFKEKIKEAQRGETGYTYYRGDSRFFANWDKPTINGFKADQDIVRMIGEPKAVFVIGLVISLLSGLALAYFIFVAKTESILTVAMIATLLATGLVVSLDAIFLAIDEISLALSKRDKVLDILDSEEDASSIIEAKETMKGQRTRATGNSQEQKEGEDEFTVS